MVYLQRWHGWCHMKQLPSRRVLYTPYNHAPCHFRQRHLRKVQVVTWFLGYLAQGHFRTNRTFTDTERLYVNLKLTDCVHGHHNWHGPMPFSINHSGTDSDSYSTSGSDNASHQNTSEKQTRNKNWLITQHNKWQTRQSQQPSSVLTFSLFNDWERSFQTDCLRYIQYKIKTQLIKSQVCLTQCHDA